MCLRVCRGGVLKDINTLDINLNVLWLPLGLTRWFDEAFVLFFHVSFVFSLVWCLVSKN